MKSFKMREGEYYGEVCIDADTFTKLDSQFFISGCSKYIKYMRANEKERKHLKSLGIDLEGCICDWFRIIKITDK